MNQNLYAIFLQRFPSDGSAPFMELPDGSLVSFDQLRHETGRMAALLAAKGVTKGDRVAVQVEKSAQTVYLYLACLQVGAIHLPLNTAYTDSELEYFLGDAEPRVVVCRPASEAAVKGIAARTGVDHVFTLGGNGDGSLVDQAASCAPLSTVAECETDDIAAILYTSGTTGRSKGAMLSHGNLLSNTQALHESWGVRPDDVLLHALPLFHTHGLFVALNLMLYNGGRVLLLPKFDADEVIRLLPKATVMMGVPTFYTRLLAHGDFTGALTRHMRLFISGSAPLLADTHHQFRERTGHAILERYGMTETCMNTSNPLNGERRAGTVGLPLPGVEVRVCDKDGTSVPPGQIGVLEVRGPNVFKGYWRMPEKTAAEFRPDGFFITGDLATIGEDGYVTIVGRDKDMIITGGYNVYPKEIELALDGLEGVNESAVIGLPHPDFGEAVVAVISTGGGRPCEPSFYIGALRSQLAAYKVPKQIFFIEDLPRNTMGKVQKNVLRERYRNAFAS
ncbi:malonyl-CoA synthase [Telmatospirillum sp. J64-1]|uniref:malonate--CoA ligase n=1 Tax=Telmatospirillum sp. J64-1 TaxID=2502183 RepID=UPI00115E7FFC|nr:malonyl-CoA synthase [Telmatospirillum sp. J64-1]